MAVFWLRSLRFTLAAKCELSPVGSTDRCNTLSLRLRDGVWNMTYRTRIKYTAEQKTEMWDRWQRGESLNSIGRAFDRPSSSIFGQLEPSGGIRPSHRQRSRLALTLSEREEISRGVAGHLFLRSIAAQLGRSPSTISREIKRNGGMITIEPHKLIKPPGLEHVAQNSVN